MTFAVINAILVATNLSSWINDIISDEAGLLAAIRDSLQQTFGDYGLGSALASFQGTSHPPSISLGVKICHWSS